MDISSITDKLARPFPREAIKTRKIGGGRDAAYIDGTAVIRRLNEATGNSWSFVVDRFWSEGRLNLALVTLTIPGMGSRQHIGVQANDDARTGEDAIAKGAITDALKKAATLFGVGLELYGPDYEDDDGPVTHPQRQGATQPAREQRTAPPGVDPVTGEITRSDGPPASDKQINYIIALGKARGFARIGDDNEEHADENQITNAINREFRFQLGSVRQITNPEARTVLDKWAPPKDDRQPRQAQQPTPIRQDVPIAPQDSDDHSYTEFWKYARSHNVDRERFIELTQQNVEGKTAQQLRALLDTALASMPKAAVQR